MDDLNVVPVIAPRSLEIALREPKSHRLDQMQLGPHTCAGARNIARILRDLRFDLTDPSLLFSILYHEAQEQIRPLAHKQHRGSL